MPHPIRLAAVLALIPTRLLADPPKLPTPQEMAVARTDVWGEAALKQDAPARVPSRWQLRLPDPPGYRITGVRIGDEELKRDADGRVDLTGETGRVVIRFAVALANPPR
jgi:hypothetical protein